MTADEYRRYWLRDNGITETDAVLMGLHFEPCDCGAHDCPGWRPVVGVDGGGRMRMPDYLGVAKLVP